MKRKNNEIVNTRGILDLINPRIDFLIEMDISNQDGDKYEEFDFLLGRKAELERSLKENGRGY